MTRKHRISSLTADEQHTLNTIRTWTKQLEAELLKMAVANGRFPTRHEIMRRAFADGWEKDFTPTR